MVKKYIIIAVFSFGSGIFAIDLIRDFNLFHVCLEGTQYIIPSTGGITVHRIMGVVQTCPLFPEKKEKKMNWKKI